MNTESNYHSRVSPGTIYDMSEESIIGNPVFYMEAPKDPKRETALVKDEKGLFLSAAKNKRK